MNYFNYHNLNNYNNHFFIILAPVNISTLVNHVVVNESAEAILECVGRGNPLPNINWMLQDGESLPERSEIETVVINEGDLENQYVKTSLVVSNISASEDGMVYVCGGFNNVTNLLSTPESASILVTVQGMLIFSDDSCLCSLKVAGLLVHYSLQFCL